MVVGDGASVRLIDVYTRVVNVLGGIGDVSAVGGIALRRDGGTGLRLAYVADATLHAILLFGVDNPSQERALLAGDVGGTSGYVDATGNGARFNTPTGIAFAERSLNSSRVLLVADAGNGVIRAFDTVTRDVGTWFAPLDLASPELVTPVGIAVSPQAPRIVYVADSGAQRVVAIQPRSSLDLNVRVLTPLTLDPTTTGSSRYVAALPYGAMATGTGNQAGYNELLVLDGAAHSLDALVQDMVASSADGGGSVAACHLACAVSGCAPLSSASLCGNGFLDAGEQCDDPSVAGQSGCFSPAGGGGNCTLRPGFACPGGASSCLNPCVGLPYAPTPGTLHCAADCLSLVPPTGYSVDAGCVVSDIDECAAGTDRCDAHRAECINTPGAYQCKCFTGYFGDGFVCVDAAYAVYTVVDVPSLSSATLGNINNPITAALLAGLEAAYASVLSAVIPSNLLAASPTITTQNAAQLAAEFSSHSLDPTFASTYARMELVVLFESNVLANDVAGAVSGASLIAGLSQALFGANTGVNVVQLPKVRPHYASSFLSPVIQGGWGMNITGVTYNRTCQLQNAAEGGFSTASPSGGCWQVEMIYMGGEALAKSDETQNAILESKNVLYLPRIERNPDTLAALVPAQTLTMTSGTYFPCDVSATSANGNGIGAAATACCLRSFEHTYRPNSQFQAFVTSAAFEAAVPQGVCSSATAGGINDTYPSASIVFDLPSTTGGGTNDLVVGHLEGMPSSEVRLLETIDYTTRTFRVLLVLEEGDLRQHASIAKGITGADYNMTFFVGLANFKGLAGSILGTQNVQQFITVSKTNELTVSTYGANQDPLLSSETMQLIRIKVSDFFNPVQYLYYLKVTFTLPANFQAPVGGSIVPLSGIRIMKVAGGQTVSATPDAWLQACASADGNFINANSTLQDLIHRAQLQTCVQANLQMCYPPLQVSSVVSFGLPLPLGFITDADFAAAAQVLARLYYYYLSTYLIIIILLCTGQPDVDPGRDGRAVLRQCGPRQCAVLAVHGRAAHAAGLHGPVRDRVGLPDPRGHHRRQHLHRHGHQRSGVDHDDAEADRDPGAGHDAERRPSVLEHHRPGRDHDLCRARQRRLLPRRPLSGTVVVVFSFFPFTPHSHPNHTPFTPQSHPIHTPFTYPNHHHHNNHRARPSTCATS